MVQKTPGISLIFSLLMREERSPHGERRRKIVSSAPPTHTHAYTYIRTCAHTCAHTQTHAHTHAHTHTSIPSTAHEVADPGHIARREWARRRKSQGQGNRAWDGDKGTLFRGDLQVQVRQKSIKDARQSLPLADVRGVGSERRREDPLTPPLSPLSTANDPDNGPEKSMLYKTGQSQGLSH